MLSIFIGVYAAVISSIYFLLPLHLQGNLKFSGAQIGLLYAVFNLNAILVAFPVGVSGDRYAARGLTRVRPSQAGSLCHCRAQNLQKINISVGIIATNSWKLMLSSRSPGLSATKNNPGRGGGSHEAV